MKLIHKPALFDATRELIAGILRRPFDGQREWSYQGLGMVRTNLDSTSLFRLNVWNHDLRIKNISNIHTHPWDLRSYIINRTLTNVRYHSDDNAGSAYAPIGDFMPESVTYYPAHGMKLGCGAHPNGSQMGEPFNITLYPQAPEVYGVGQVYTQERDEIHETRYDDGTVSLNVRTNKREDSSATVFWPRGTEWVDAKQNMPTREQVHISCACALACWEEWPRETGTFLTAKPAFYIHSKAVVDDLKRGGRYKMEDVPGTAGTLYSVVDLTTGERGAIHDGAPIDGTHVTEKPRR